MAERELTKAELKVLANKFGGCGCKHACAREQYSREEAPDHKPRGRFTVCEIQADELGIDLPGRDAGGRSRWELEGCWRLIRRRRQRTR